MSNFWIDQGDAVSWLKAMPAESVDLVVTDPAYESLEKHREHGTTTRLKQSKGSSNEWFPIFPNARFEELFAEVYRVLKRDRHFYLFCDPETLFFAKPIAEVAGFRFRKAIVWDKMKIGMGYSYRARHEFILYVEKGKRRLNDLGVPDVLQFKRIKGGKPTEKPVGLNEVFVKQSSNPGELVVDPFVGSGASGVAAVRNGRNFLGCDILDGAVTYASARIQEAGGEPKKPKVAELLTV